MRTRRPSSQLIARLVADALLINVAVLAALVGRFLYLIGFESVPVRPTYYQTLWDFVLAYRNNAWLLTLICLIVFALSGFYTYGRAYRGRAKALIVFQAVCLGYLVYSFLSYFFRPQLDLPRGSLVVAWILTLALMLAARLWARVWTGVVNAERHQVERPALHPALRTVLVIGGAGYIGSALLPKLLAQNYRVRVLDLLLYGSEPIADVLGHPRLEVVQADFRQVDKVVEAMQGVDVVIHLGAIVGDPACALDEELTIEVNLMATRMVAEVAKGCGVNRFIFASTCSVYGASDEILDERSALNPVSLYARSKVASERVLRNLAGDRFTPIILRFATIYGLSGRTRFDLVANLLTAKAVADGQITVFDGDQWRPFLHVDDAALAVFRALEAPLSVVRNQVFNVGSDEQNYTIAQVGELIHRLVPTAQLLNMGTGADRRNYRVNFSKIRHTLHFVPRWTLERGIGQVITAVRDGQVQDYRDARYSNVKFLSEEGTTRLARRGNGWAYDLLAATSPLPVWVEA